MADTCPTTNPIIERSITLSEPQRNPEPLPSLPVLTRREAVKGACAALGVAGWVAAMSPLREFAKETKLADFLQHHAAAKRQETIV